MVQMLCYLDNHQILTIYFRQSLNPKNLANTFQKKKRKKN